MFACVSGKIKMPDRTYVPRRILYLPLGTGKVSTSRMAKVSVCLGPRARLAGWLTIHASIWLAETVTRGHVTCEVLHMHTATVSTVITTKTPVGWSAMG